ncbi:MAG: hypothetical protein DDT26_02220 [Dehalococcoidia bacterium]|nr:hypothetical protein [Chloroflexota bacterium]
MVSSPGRGSNAQGESLQITHIMRIGLGKAFDRNEEISGFGTKPIHQPAAFGQDVTKSAPVGYIIDKFFSHLVVAEAKDTTAGVWSLESGVWSPRPLPLTLDL